MSDDSFDPGDFEPEPIDPDEILEAYYREEYPDYDSLYDAIHDFVPDAPEGVWGLVENFIDDMSYEELLDMFVDWGDDYADFWDWFRDEFYGEG